MCYPVANKPIEPWRSKQVLDISAYLRDERLERPKALSTCITNCVYRKVAFCPILVCKVPLSSVKWQDHIQDAGHSKGSVVKMRIFKDVWSPILNNIQRYRAQQHSHRLASVPFVCMYNALWRKLEVLMSASVFSVFGLVNQKTVPSLKRFCNVSVVLWLSKKFQDNRTSPAWELLERSYKKISWIFTDCQSFRMTNYARRPSVFHLYSSSPGNSW